MDWSHGLNYLKDSWIRFPPAVLGIPGSPRVCYGMSFHYLSLQALQCMFVQNNIEQLLAMFVRSEDSKT